MTSYVCVPLVCVAHRALEQIEIFALQLISLQATSSGVSQQEAEEVTTKIQQIINQYSHDTRCEIISFPHNKYSFPMKN